MDPLIAQGAMSLGTSVIGSVFGMGANKYSNELAAERESKARAENYKYSELAANNADKRTRQLYEDLQSPKALLSQYQDAGLSPSLMYGGSGVGGTLAQGAQGNGAGGISPTTFAYQSLEGAQIAKTLAEAKLMNVSADEKQGATPMSQAQIEKIMAETGHIKAAENYTKAQEVGQSIANRLADKTFNYSVQYFESQADEMLHRAQKTAHEVCTAEAMATVAKETVEAQIENAKLQNKDLVANIALKWSQKNLTEQEIKESETRIWTLVEQVSIDWVKALAEESNATTYQEWVTAKLPYIEQELELEAERLNIEEKRVWIDGVAKTIQGVGCLVMAGSAVGKAGQGGNLSPSPKDFNKGFKRGGNALGKGVPIYKTNNTYGF